VATIQIQIWKTTIKKIRGFEPVPSVHKQPQYVSVEMPNNNIYSVKKKKKKQSGVLKQNNLFLVKLCYTPGTFAVMAFQAVDVPSTAFDGCRENPGIV
jgi:hypothetical protein